MRGVDAMLGVALSDIHGPPAPVGLLGIPSIAFRLLEQFCNSSRALLVAQFWAGWVCYAPAVTCPVVRSQRGESISTPRCLWWWGADWLTGKRQCAYLRSPGSRFAGSLAGHQVG